MDGSIDPGYYKVFEDAKVRVCTQEEFDRIQVDRKTEIGLSDEILEQESFHYYDVWKRVSD